MNECAICGRPTSETRAPRPWMLVRCDNCHHVQIQGLSDVAQDNPRIQVSHFGDEFLSRQGVWTQAIERANARRVAQRIRRWLPNGSCLEVGPGSGELLGRLRYLGYEVKGLDVSDAIARHVRSKFGIEVINQSLDDFSAPRGKVFDVMVMRHVLEHMVDPISAIDVAKQMIRSGGILYVAVPNIAAVEARLSGWTGYQPYHLQYFNAASLGHLLRTSGFELLSVRTREPFSGWVNALVNSVRRCSGHPESRQGGDVHGESPLIYHAYNCCRLILGTVAWPARWAQAAMGTGEELEVVARRA